MRLYSKPTFIFVARETPFEKTSFEFIAWVNREFHTLKQDCAIKKTSYFQSRVLFLNRPINL